MAVSLQFLSRSSGNCAAQALAAASPKVLSACTPKSLRGCPTPRSFAGISTPKTPARSPYSAAGSSPFFGGSPVFGDFERATRASTEASAQLARLALPSASSARQHCLARLGRRGSQGTLESSESNSADPSSDVGGHPRLGLSGRSIPSHSRSQAEFQDASMRAPLPSLLGQRPPQVPADSPAQSENSGSERGLQRRLRFSPSLEGELLKQEEEEASERLARESNMATLDTEQVAPLPTLLGRPRRSGMETGAYFQGSVSSPTVSTVASPTESMPHEAFAAAEAARLVFLRRRSQIASRAILTTVP